MMSRSKKIKLVGRPKQTPVSKLKAKLWYNVVKTRSGLSDYSLDMTFGQPEGPITQGGAGRNRVFGPIKKGVLPSRGQHKKRSFDVVERVNTEFPGTADIIDSPLWELLDTPARDLESITALVERCLDLLDLTRITGKAAFEWSIFAEKDLDGTGKPSLRSQGATPYEMSLKLATQGVSSQMTLLALYGALYREACLSFNLENADILADFINAMLAFICDEVWMIPHERYFRLLVTERILYGKSEYLPPERLDFDSVDSVGILASPSHSYVVSKNNKKYDFFSKNFNIIQIAHKARILSIMPEDIYESAVKNGKVSEEEKEAVQYFKKESKFKFD